MRVLMFGWAFPPHLSGGVGAACAGLTRALAAAGVGVTFVLPEDADPVDAEDARVLTTRPDAEGPPGPAARTRVHVADAALAEEGAEARSRSAARPGLSLGVPTPPPLPRDPEEIAGVSIQRVPASLPGPYAAATRAHDAGTVAGDAGGRLWGAAGSGEVAAAADGPATGVPAPGTGSSPAPGTDATPGGDPGPAPPAESEETRRTRRYADACVALAERLAGEAEAAGAPGFDAVHAHDWPTFPAGAAVADALGLPLLVHVHATEHERSGEHGDAPGSPIRAIEAAGLARADRVLAVSRRTADVLRDRYAVPPEKVAVVHNAAEPGTPAAAAPASIAAIPAGDKVVLFLGRLTEQKGAGRFIDAAEAVLDRRPGTTFVVAGSGEAEPDAVERARRGGVADRFVFTGFLRGEAVAAAYDRADVYVMPSASEPFGIAPLEAARRGTPVIVSKQSGVSEVLEHALKVDFWDTEGLADQILAVLNHEALGRTLRAHAGVQARGLTWEAAATEVIAAYEHAARK